MRALALGMWRSGEGVKRGERRSGPPDCAVDSQLRGPGQIVQTVLDDKVPCVLGLCEMMLTRPLSVKQGCTITNELDLKTCRDRSFKRVLFDLVPEARGAGERSLARVTLSFRPEINDIMRTLPTSPYLCHVVVPATDATLFKKQLTIQHAKRHDRIFASRKSQP